MHVPRQQLNKLPPSSHFIFQFYEKIRYDTAAAISKETWEYTENVIIGNGANFSDALTRVTLAYAYDLLCWQKIMCKMH